MQAGGITQAGRSDDTDRQEGRHMQAGAMTQARRRDHTGTQRTAFEEHLVGGEAPAALLWLSPYSRVPRLNQNSHSHRCELWSVSCARELWARQPERDSQART